MTSSSSGVPNYPSKPHKSGQARIWIKGRTFYLGVYGSAPSKAKYARLIAEHFGSDQPVIASNKTQVTVAELLASFMAHAVVRYQKNGKPTSEVNSFSAAIGPLVELYSDILANDFGPIALAACRDELNRRGYCRTKVNQHLGRIRRIWKWGVAKQLVKVEAWQALTAVEGLRIGEGKEMPKVRKVQFEAAIALEGHVVPEVWTMIQLQLVTAMRPGEVVQMRTCDISMCDDLVPKSHRNKLWVYRPATHKTEHHGKERVILIGPQAQDVLRKWLRPDEPEGYLFSPALAVASSRRQRTEQATTLNTKFRRKSHPKRAPRKFYDTHAYATAIERGCELAYGMPAELRLDKRAKRFLQMSAEEIENRRLEARKWRQKYCWNPNQLRHTAATWIRSNFNAEVARIILGHAHLNTTEIYAEEDMAKATAAMVSVG